MRKVAIMLVGVMWVRAGCVHVGVRLVRKHVAVVVQQRTRAANMSTQRCQVRAASLRRCLLLHLLRLAYTDVDVADHLDVLQR